jgi:hypothetical protein
MTKYLWRRGGGAILLILALVTAPAWILAAGAAQPDQHLPEAVRAGRVWLVLIDDLSIRNDERASVMQTLDVVKSLLIRTNDLLTIASTGFSSVASAPRYDPAGDTLDFAIAKVRNAPAAGSGPPSADVEAFERHLAHVSIRTTRSLLAQTESLTDRPKTLLLVTAGSTAGAFADARLRRALELGPVAAVVPRRTAVSEADLLMDLAALAQAAARSGTQVYRMAGGVQRVTPFTGFRGSGVPRFYGIF